MQTARRYPPTRNTNLQRHASRFQQRHNASESQNGHHAEQSASVVKGVAYTKAEMSERRYTYNDVASFAKAAAEVNNMPLTLPTNWQDIVKAHKSSARVIESPMNLPDANDLMADMLRLFSRH